MFCREWLVIVARVPRITMFLKACPHDVHLHCLPNLSEAGRRMGKILLHICILFTSLSCCIDDASLRQALRLIPYRRYLSQLGGKC